VHLREHADTVAELRDALRVPHMICRFSRQSSTARRSRHSRSPTWKVVVKPSSVNSRTYISLMCS
jgi:hypothetical protein